MERCFNFLVNVDQCLNMSNFDMFFYKLQSSSLFHLNNVQFNSEDPATSLLVYPLYLFGAVSPLMLSSRALALTISAGEVTFSMIALSTAS